MKKKNEEIASLQKEVKRLKQELGRNNRNGGGSYSSYSTYSAPDNNRFGYDQNNMNRASSYSDMKAAQKRERTCREWNEYGCSKRGKDKNHCGFGAAALRHACSKVLNEDKICWGNHTESNHV